MVAQGFSLPTQGERSAGSVKLLDLLTNRYHLGVIRQSSEAGMQIDLPASTGGGHFHAGQRVRFIVAGEQGLISRSAMQRAFITQVSPIEENQLSIHLAMLPETAVA